MCSDIFWPFLAAAPPTVVYLPDTVSELFSSVRFWRSRRLLNITSMGIYGNALGITWCCQLRLGLWTLDGRFNDLRLAQQHGEWHNFRLKARPRGPAAAGEVRGWAPISEIFEVSTQSSLHNWGFSWDFQLI